MKIRLTLTSLVVGRILNVNTSAQQTIQASLGTINRPTPKIGFNSNGHMPTANWTMPDFVDSAATLNSEILRYPGGTNANHWDWQTGWYLPSFQPPFTLMIRADEFLVGATASNAEGLFVLNYETSNLTYEMQGLQHASDLGFAMNYIEIGNEHNLPNSLYTNQLMDPVVYGQDCKVWADTIKAAFPNAKICVVGGNGQAVPTWNNDILAQNPNIDAFAWHAYLNGNNSDLVFNVNRALAVAFGAANVTASLPNRFNQGGFSALPANKEIWVTEYNLWETQIASAPVIAETWTHTLYLTALHHYFLTNTRVSMFLNHSLASIDAWHQSIYSQDHHITANGIGMKLLLDVSKGSQTSENIAFAGNPSITYGSTTFPKLIGWKFNHSNFEKGFICNFSSDTFTVSLQQVFTNPMDIVTYSADTNFRVLGIASLNSVNGNSSDSITILPYSFTQINSAPVVTNLNEGDSVKELLIYPNPAKDLLSFSEMLYDVEVCNLIGETVLQVNEPSQFITTTSLCDGIYFLKSNKGTVKFALKH